MEKSSLKVSQAAKQIDMKSTKLMEMLNAISGDKRYTSFNQYLLEVDIEVVRQINEANKAAVKEEDETVIDVDDEFFFAGILYDFNTGEYQSVKLKMTRDEALKYVVLSAEKTKQISRASMRYKKIVDKLATGAEHPLAIRRNKWKTKK